MASPGHWAHAQRDNKCRSPTHNPDTCSLKISNSSAAKMSLARGLALTGPVLFLTSQMVSGDEKAQRTVLGYLKCERLPFIHLCVRGQMADRSNLCSLGLLSGANGAEKPFRASHGSVPRKSTSVSTRHCNRFASVAKKPRDLDHQELPPGTGVRAMDALHAYLCAGGSLCALRVGARVSVCTKCRHQELVNILVNKNTLSQFPLQLLRAHEAFAGSATAPIDVDVEVAASAFPDALLLDLLELQ